jgi:hypothetical protein
MAIVTGRDHAWMEIEGKRQSMKTGTNIPVNKYKKIRIRSKRSYGSIEVEGAYVVLPLSISLPRMPEWLRRALEELARASRILIADPKVVAGSITSSATDFVQAVKLLETQLAAVDVVLEGKNIPDPRQVQIEYSGSEIANVRRAAKALNNMLDKQNVVQLVTPGHFCTV